MINFHGPVLNALRCQILVSAKFWCPYGTCTCTFDFTQCNSIHYAIGMHFRMKAAIPMCHPIKYGYILNLKLYLYLKKNCTFTYPDNSRPGQFPTVQVLVLRSGFSGWLWSWWVVGGVALGIVVIDLMQWRHVSITTMPCWGSRLVALCTRARARACPAVWHAGVGPLAACLAMAHVTVPRLTPNTRGRPSVTSYA